MRWSVPITVTSVTATIVVAAGVATACVIALPPTAGGPENDIGQLAPDRPHPPGPGPSYGPPTPLPGDAYGAKQSLLANESADPDFFLPPASITWMSSVRDKGSSSDIKAVKTATVADLQTDMAGQALTCGTSCTSEPPLTADQVAAHLQPSLSVWASSVRAATQTQEVDARLAAQDDSTYVPYSAFRWDVTKWDGVQVHGDTALAVFEGYQDYLIGGSWQRDDNLVQEQIMLVFEDGSWKLLDQEGVGQ